jgi:hypothetical protein
MPSASPRKAPCQAGRAGGKYIFAIMLDKTYQIGYYWVMEDREMTNKETWKWIVMVGETEYAFSSLRAAKYWAYEKNGVVLPDKMRR